MGTRLNLYKVKLTSVTHWLLCDCKNRVKAEVREENIVLKGVLMFWHNEQAMF
jgi:hypothetical protein